ncbi:MAG: sodium:calcium antiporter [Microgenomates group bacterium]
MIILNFIFYLLSFFLIWYSAGLIISSIDRLAHRFSLSRFAVSFFILGILTSVPEISVGVNAIVDKKPEIFVGNLLGASLVIFLLTISFLAIFGGGVKLVHQLESKNLLLSLLVVASPSFLIVDKKVTVFEGIFLIILYSLLFYSIEKKKGLFERIKDQVFNHHHSLMKEVCRLIVGVATVFLASKFIVDQTIYFSQIFNVSSFLIALLFLSVGTNLPELALTFRSIFEKKKEVAFGDYIGSAAANSLIFGVLTFLAGGEVIVVDNFLKILFFTAFGLGAFFLFSRSKNDISRKEGFALLFIYLLFLASEVFNWF